MINFIKLWASCTGITVARFIGLLGLAPIKYYDWQSCYGKANGHNALVPCDFWLEDWEKQPNAECVGWHVCMTSHRYAAF